MGYEKGKEVRGLLAGSAGDKHEAVILRLTFWLTVRWILNVFIFSQTIAVRLMKDDEA